MTGSYFILGPVAGTTMTRYAVLHGDHTVWQVQISRPDGVEVERPTRLRWRQASPHEVEIKRYRFKQAPVSHKG